MKKKLLTSLLIVTMVIGCTLTSQAALKSNTEEETPSITQEEVKENWVDIPEGEADFVNWTKILTYGTFDEPMVFNLLPDGYNTCESQYKGQVLRMHYTTDAYEDGITYEKYVTVYLPYCYDAEDKDTKYNVIYFQHGNGGSPNEMWDHIMKSANCNNLFDNMFDPEHGIMEPCIIICPTYYIGTPEDEFVTPGDTLAGDGRDDRIAGNYYLEVVEDLIPQIESQFNVYCEDFSDEGIKASRDHRAWAGYSRGCMCTWYMFHNDLEYFKYWMPMSCSITPIVAEGEDADPYNYVTADIIANPDLDFFIYATCGNATDGKGMREQIKEFLDHEDSLFSYGNDPSVNNLYLICSEFNHNDLYFPYSLANQQEVLFK